MKKEKKNIWSKITHHFAWKYYWLDIKITKVRKRRKCLRSEITHHLVREWIVFARVCIRWCVFSFLFFPFISLDPSSVFSILFRLIYIQLLSRIKSEWRVDEARGFFITHFAWDCCWINTKITKRRKRRCIRSEITHHLAWDYYGSTIKITKATEPRKNI